MSAPDGASKSNDDNVFDVIGKLQSTQITADNNDIIVSICANCGKEGNDINNTCIKCKMVKYCNAACKKKHKKKHKKECEEHIRLAAELAAKLHDEKLFKQPPPKKDCPICFIRKPSLDSSSTYQSCCGKSICCGCFYAPLYDNQGNKVDNKKCPFCRIPYPASLEEEVQRIKKRGEAGDAQAFFNMGCYYRDGKCGFPQDYAKALEFYHRAAELGYARSYCSIGYCYHYGRGVRQDMKKALHYYELSAMGGEEVARYNVAMHEERARNYDRAVKHHMIAVMSGDAGSLGRIKALYGRGFLTKDVYTQALRSYQEYLTEIKSVQRDEAAAAYEKYRYY